MISSALAVLAVLAALSGVGGAAAAPPGGCVAPPGDATVFRGHGIVVWYPQTVAPGGYATAYGCSVKGQRVVTLASVPTECPGSGAECGSSQAAVGELISSGAWVALVLDVNDNGDEAPFMALGNALTGQVPSPRGLAGLDAAPDAMVLRDDGALAWIVSSDLSSNHNRRTLLLCDRSCRQNGSVRVLDSAAHLGALRFTSHRRLLWSHNGRRRSALVS